MAKDVRVPEGRALLVGLGNPGSTYEGTRHNIGWIVLDALAHQCSASIQEKKFKALLGQGQLGLRPVTFVKPQTYMNLSGESVGPCAGFYRLPTSSILVLHDDIDLPAGRIRIKVGGGHGGHNGLRSLDQHLPDKEYFRIRLGVGRPPHGDVSAWVLGRFAMSDREQLITLIDTAIDAVTCILNDGLLAAQNRFHAG